MQDEQSAAHDDIVKDDVVDLEFAAYTRAATGVSAVSVDCRYADVC